MLMDNRLRSVPLPGGGIYRNKMDFDPAVLPTAFFCFIRRNRIIRSQSGGADP